MCVNRHENQAYSAEGRRIMIPSDLEKLENDSVSDERVLMYDI
jgi:hypothetical protein